jgi:hypothetical protein
MEQRYLISPRVAIGTAVVAGISLIVAIAIRDRPIAEATTTVEVPPPIDAGAPPDTRDVVAATPSVPPTIESVKAEARLETLGVALELDVAIALAAVADKREHVRVKASCKLDGEWYAGSGSLYLAKLPAGTSVVQTKLSLGTQHAFAATPSECHLGFEYTSYVTRPSVRAQIAKMCFDGAQVIDKPCATKPNTDVSVSAVRVETSRDRYRRRVDAPVDLEVSLDAELEKPLDDWSIEVAADCTLPDGTTQRASERVSTRDVHAGRPFTGKTRLFRGKQQMLDVPTACTVVIDVADRQQLVREEVARWCWRDGAVANGACA